MINRNFGAKTRAEVERESMLIARLTRNKFIDKNIYITDIQINYFYFFKWYKFFYCLETLKSY